MAFSVTLVNVSPRGSLRIVTDDGAQIVERDGTVDVTPEAAGEAPRWRRATERELELIDLPELPPGVSPLHTRQHAGQTEVFDLGSGLLAQAENWRKAGDTSDPADPTAPGHPVAANTEEN